MRVCAGLGAVGGGLFHREGQVSEFCAHGVGAVRGVAAVVGEDAGAQVEGFARVEHVEADGGDVVPAGGAACGDQNPAVRQAVQERADVAGCR